MKPWAWEATRTVKSIDDLKRDTAALVRAEHERRLDREARDRRDGNILDAFDRLAEGQPMASEATPAPRHRPRLALVRPVPRWTGPLESDWASHSHTSLRSPVPPERWPYGPPDHHEACCDLHAGGLFCDCKASAADDDEYGETP